MQAKVLASILWIPFCSDLSGYMESAISVGVAVTIVPTRSRFESTCEPLNPRPVETNRQWPTKERQKERPRPETLVLVCLRTPFSSPPSESVAMSVKTVKISNVSLRASERDIKEFFSFSGDIEYVEMQKGDESSQAAYVTFKDTQGAETSMLLTGATIVDLSVVITPAPDYELPPEAAAAIASAAKDANAVPGGESVIQKAESVVTTMLAKGFVLGKDAVGKAKTFDEKHQLTSTATSKVSALNQKIGFTEKISMGASAVNEKVLEMDSKFQVTEKARSAVAAAEQKVGNASSAIMKNRYVFTSAAWVSGAFNKVAKAASEVGSKAMEKVVASEPESNKDLEDEVAKVHISETSPVASQEPPRKPEPAQGLVL